MGKKVTVVGAGFYGSTTAQRLAEYDIFDTVVLTDIIDGKPAGLALDINQSRPVEGFETKVVGVTTGANGEGYEAVEGSDVVVITAGLPRKPGMSRMDLLEVNAKIVRQVAENVAKYAPNAVVIVVSNPVDEMTALARIATQFPHHRVFGQEPDQALGQGRLGGDHLGHGVGRAVAPRRHRRRGPRVGGAGERRLGIEGHGGDATRPVCSPACQNGPACPFRARRRRPASKRQGSTTRRSSTSTTTSGPPPSCSHRTPSRTTSVAPWTSGRCTTTGLRSPGAGCSPA